MSDLIDRQAAIEALEELARARYKWSTDARDEIKGIDVSICAIDEVPRAKPADNWIPVSERLPESDAIVLISVRCRKYDGSIGVVVVDGSYWELAGEWYSENMGGLNDDDVLAWQPLPEPYKG